MRCARCCIQRCNKLNKCAIRQHCAQGLPWTYILGQLHRKCMFTKWCASFRSVASEDLLRHCNKVIFPGSLSLSTCTAPMCLLAASLHESDKTCGSLIIKERDVTPVCSSTRGDHVSRVVSWGPTSWRRPRGVARGSTVRSILATTSWPIYCAHSRVLRMSLTRAAYAQPGATSLRGRVVCLAAPLATIAQYTWTLAT